MINFHFIWDASVSKAPAAFKTAVEAAGNFLARSFMGTTETLNIDVGWGEVDGAPLNAAGSYPAMSAFPGVWTSYADLLDGLKNVGAEDANTLPATDPLDAANYYVTYAEEKTLKMIPNSGMEADGEIGINSAYDWSFSQSETPAKNQYDAVGVLEQEISHVMGRISSVGVMFGSDTYTPLDLYRYQAPGVRATDYYTETHPYFSVNGGKTDLGNYLTNTDLADWNYHGSADGIAMSGVTLKWYSNDTTEMAVLGYNPV